MTRHRTTLVSIARSAVLPNGWDLVAFVLVLGVLALLAVGAHDMTAPALPEAAVVSLDPRALPYYALRTTLRMLIALVASLLFSLVYGAVAAKSVRAGAVLVPILDILQSVPVLGFLSVTVTFFIGLFPGSTLGPECAAIFAIFTSQAWNMTFSVYQSLRTVPRDLDEASRAFGQSAWQRLWRLEVPFAVPGLVWNAMMSMSGGWFFVVASEAITVGSNTVTLPGIGSYIAQAIAERRLDAIGWAVAAMLLVIVAYDQLLFRPATVWADRFRVEQSASQLVGSSWMLGLVRRGRMAGAITQALDHLGDMLVRIGAGARASHRSPTVSAALAPAAGVVWWGGVAAGVAWGGWSLAVFVAPVADYAELLHVVRLAGATLLRVVVLMVLATLVWVPIGVWIGLQPRLAERLQGAAQLCAAFPANLLFPVAVALIVRWHLDPDVWLSPLMILGTQWYILFNVIAGARSFPTDLRDVAASFGVVGRRWWTAVILPGVFPSYLTGAITASGGSWNASIVAERAQWGDVTLTADGLGAYIAVATAAGDQRRVILGVAVMAAVVVLFNRTIWRSLYRLSERRLRLD